MKILIFCVKISDFPCENLMIFFEIFLTIYKISYDKFRVSTGSVETRWLGGNFLMVYRNNAGRLGSGFISACLKTRWLGQISGFYVQERYWMSTNRQTHRVRFPEPKSRGKNVSRFHQNRYVLADDPTTSLVCILRHFSFASRRSPPAVTGHHSWASVIMVMRFLAVLAHRAASFSLGTRNAHQWWGTQATHTPWANQMNYHAAHTPRPWRTQDCYEIWR